MQTTQMSWFDNNEPISVPVYSDDESICLNKIEFTHEDNPYITPKGKVTIYTCTWKNYVAIRPLLTHLFSGFVTMVNSERFRTPNSVINPNNRNFVNLLPLPEHELFILPAQITNTGTLSISGGVRLVSTRFIRMGNHNTRFINLCCGDKLQYQNAYLLDRYFESPEAVHEYPTNLSFI